MFLAWWLFICELVMLRMFLKWFYMLDLLHFLVRWSRLKVLISS